MTLEDLYRQAGSLRGAVDLLRDGLASYASQSPLPSEDFEAIVFAMAEERGIDVHTVHAFGNVAADPGQRLECEAFLDGPGGHDQCLNRAIFVIDRSDDDTRLTSCANHLGALVQGKNVLWPPRIAWLGRGHSPPEAVLLGNASLQRDPRRRNTQ